MEGTKQPREPRRPNYNFEKMDIPIGSKLTFCVPKNPEMTEIIDVLVISERKVRYQNREDYLTGIIRNILQKEPELGPCHYWKYNGIPLTDIFNKGSPKTPK